MHRTRSPLSFCPLRKSEKIVWNQLNSKALFAKCLFAHLRAPLLGDCCAAPSTTSLSPASKIWRCLQNHSRFQPLSCSQDDDDDPQADNIFIVRLSYFLTPRFSRTNKEIFEPFSNKQSFDQPLDPQIDFFFENCNHWHYFCTLWKGWKSLKVNSVPISARCFWELNYPPRNQDSH